MEYLYVPSPALWPGDSTVTQTSKETSKWLELTFSRGPATGEEKLWHGAGGKHQWKNTAEAGVGVFAAGIAVWRMVVSEL